MLTLKMIYEMLLRD